MMTSSLQIGKTINLSLIMDVSSIWVSGYYLDLCSDVKLWHMLVVNYVWVRILIIMHMQSIYLYQKLVDDTTTVMYTAYPSHFCVMLVAHSRQHCLDCRQFIWHITIIIAESFSKPTKMYGCLVNKTWTANHSPFTHPLVLAGLEWWQTCDICTYTYTDLYLQASCGLWLCSS